MNKISLWFAYRPPRYNGETIARWIAHKLPRKVVYFCAIRVWAHGTTKKYSCDNASESIMADMISRWEV